MDDDEYHTNNINKTVNNNRKTELMLIKTKNPSIIINVIGK